MEMECNIILSFFVLTETADIMYAWDILVVRKPYAQSFTVLTFF